MKKYIIALIGLLCLGTASFAQNTTKIQGLTYEQNTNEVVPFVTIATYKDSLLVDGTSSDENGKFSFKTDKVFNTIEFSFLGYESLVFMQNEIPKTKNWNV